MNAQLYLGNSGDAPNLPWQCLRYRPAPGIQFQFSRAQIIAEEQEKLLEELAVRLQVLLDLVLTNKK